MKSFQHRLLAGAAVLALAGAALSVWPWLHPATPGSNQSPFTAQAQTLGGLLGNSIYNVDEHGRIPFQMTQHREGQCAGNECFFSFGFVPQGKRLVLTRISGANVLNAPPSQVFVYANNGTGSSVANFIAPVANNTVSYDHLTEAFYDAGQFIEIQVAPFPSTFLGGNALQVVTVAGYMVTCSVATPCSPFAATNPNHP